MEKISEHFWKWEARCGQKNPCFFCKGETLVVPQLVFNLEMFRSVVKKPVFITSWYRCGTRNREIGGTKASYHTTGLAVDLWVEGMDCSELFTAAESVPGFRDGGIGIYPKGDKNGYHDRIHVDLGTKRRWSVLEGQQMPLQMGLDLYL